MQQPSPLSPVCRPSCESGDCTTFVDNQSIQLTMPTYIINSPVRSLLYSEEFFDVDDHDYCHMILCFLLSKLPIILFILYILTLYYGWVLREFQHQSHRSLEDVSPHRVGGTGKCGSLPERGYRSVSLRLRIADFFHGRHSYPVGLCRSHIPNKLLRSASAR